MFPVRDWPEPRRDRPTSKAREPRRVRIEALMEEATELILIHRGAEYRLRITANGKLILTK